MAKVEQPALSSSFSIFRFWERRISWRVSAAVFATILLVQTVVLIFTSRSYEAELLSRLREEGRLAISQALGAGAPLEKERVQQLLDNAPVRGFAVHALDGTVIEVEGAPTLLRPSAAGGTYRTPDDAFYETVFLPPDLGRPYTVVARLDSAFVQPQVGVQIRQTLVILMLMSGFVTSVLMLVLGEWLLDPLRLLRNNLLAAARHPENPEVRKPKEETKDEVGVAVRLAGDLIRQNADNLKRLKAQAEDKIHRLAYFDTLTGLPNRSYFLEQLDELIRTKAPKPGELLAVLVVDIDHFKDINDSMGYEIGDRLLEAVSRRLVKSLPDNAVVARNSADQFLIKALLRGGEDETSEALGMRIFGAMREPVSVQQESFQVRVSIGVAHYPGDGDDARTLLKNADIALNRAKEEGRETMRVYSPEFDQAVQKRFSLLRALRRALDNNELLLHYHPQFDLKTGAMIGAEALLRWWKPEEGVAGGGRFISPVEFIPVAEQSGLIIPIGAFVLKKACETNKKWQDEGLPPFRIAVNVSGIQFHRDDIVALTKRTLEETGLDPHWLELEVTESAFMDDIDAMIETLERLHGLGIELSVDDFGTGYSSLNYLRQFPIDRLKIDQSFTRNSLVSEGDAAVTRTIVALGHSLGLKVIAEGVEEEAHEQFLKDIGCDEAQGFKYTKPLPEDKLREFAAAWTVNKIRRQG